MLRRYLVENLGQSLNLSDLQFPYLCNYYSSIYSVVYFESFFYSSSALSHVNICSLITGIQFLNIIISGYIIMSGILSFTDISVTAVSHKPGPQRIQCKRKQFDKGFCSPQVVWQPVFKVASKGPSSQCPCSYVMPSTLGLVCMTNRLWLIK